MFLLFAGCALLPILGLAFVSYNSVNRELFQQAEDRLASTSKSLAMGIWERLAILDSELQIVAAQSGRDTGANQIAARSVLGEDLSSRLRGIVVEDDGSRPRVVWGFEFEPPELSPEESIHLGTGRPLFKIMDQGTGESQIVLGRKWSTLGADPLMIWGEIEPAYIWWGAGQESTLPAGNELLVLDSSKSHQVYSTLPGELVLPEEMKEEVGQGSHEGILWQVGGTEFLGHYRVVNLRPAFLYPSLTLVVSEPRDFVVQPLATFKRSFLAILLATLLVVMLLSMRQIRSSLIPLEKLREATRSVASGNFGVTVSIETEDEFSELAGSFNSMAGSLERQFATLKSLNQLQQTVLSTLDVNRMVATVLEQFGRIFPSEQVSVCVMKPDCGGAGWIYYRKTSPIQSAAVDPIEISSREMAAFQASRHHLEVNLSDNDVSFVPRGQSSTLDSVTAFPAFLKDELVAVVVAGCSDSSRPAARDFDAARQITNQVAIGLSNIRLIHELDDLNWGTLSALARAIDVRSSWTMGHTERVTGLAQQIGRSLSLSKERLDNLHRGGLLHDIGKIGVPSEVLDKPSSLTAEEMDLVREHVRLGVRIIDPIPALADALPIVLQHHEWFNGQGYPAGLVGNEICVEARILSVADCYDALRSVRPYRGDLSHEEVMEYICNGAGKQFDPQIVEAFVQIMREIHGPLQPGTELPDLTPPLMAT